MCAARQKQVLDKRAAQNNALTHDLLYHQHTRELDATDSDAALEAQYKKNRLDADAKNRQMIERRRVQVQAATRGGLTDSEMTGQLYENPTFVTNNFGSGDVFGGRPDEESNHAERAKTYGESLKRTITENRARRDGERLTELTADQATAERDAAELARSRTLAAEDKALRDTLKKSDLTKQMEEQRSRAGIPKVVGYGPSGDPFTLQEDPAEQAEHAAHVRLGLQSDLRTQAHQRKERAVAEREADMAFSREAADMERAALSAEVDAFLRTKDERARLVGASLRSQMQERQTYREQHPEEAKGVAGYGPEGDRFTQGESEEEARVRAAQKSRAVQADQLHARSVHAAQAVREQEARRQEQAYAREDDIAAREFDARQNALHTAYIGSIKDAQRSQIEADRLKHAAMHAEDREFSRTGLDVGEADEADDCERPTYRTRRLTKKERLIAGF